VFDDADAATGQHGFMTDGTTFTAINVPGAQSTHLWGVNNVGQIVGAFWDGLRYHGILIDGAALTTLDAPGATYTEALGINDEGQIVGRFLAGSGHGFLTDGTIFTTLDVPFSGTENTQARSINAAGQIVGHFARVTGTHGFLATPDITPPVVTLAVSPATLSPPNGKLVAVTVSGTITDGDNGSGVQASTYQVIDEYGQVQPSGNVATEADGSYAFTVELQASRRGNDRDGRRYTIEVSATDDAGNEGSKSATVTVPRK
jgi:uncharacterized membrane protein